MSGPLIERGRSITECYVLEGADYLPELSTLYATLWHVFGKSFCGLVLHGRRSEVST